MWFGNQQPQDYFDPDWTNGGRKRRRRWPWFLLALAILVVTAYAVGS